MAQADRAAQRAPPGRLQDRLAAPAGAPAPLNRGSPNPKNAAVGLARWRLSRSARNASFIFDHSLSLSVAASSTAKGTAEAEAITVSGLPAVPDGKVIDREVKDIVTDAAEFATTSPEPDPSELWTDVLVEA